MVAFCPWSILVHYVRTRRNVWGVLLGLFWLAAVLMALFLVGLGMDWVAERLA